VINATSNPLNSPGTSTCVIAPIRDEPTSPATLRPLAYNTATNEVVTGYIQSLRRAPVLWVDYGWYNTIADSGGVPYYVGGSSDSFGHTGNLTYLTTNTRVRFSILGYNAVSGEGAAGGFPQVPVDNMSNNDAAGAPGTWGILKTPGVGFKLQPWGQFTNVVVGWELDYGY
jgi:hypothetical protein